MSLPPLQRLEWVFWVALTYFVAYSLYVCVDWFIRLGRAYLVQKEIDAMPLIDERTERAKRAALTFPRRRVM